MLPNPYTLTTLTLAPDVSGANYMETCLSNFKLLGKNSLRILAALVFEGFGRFRPASNLYKRIGRPESGRFPFFLIYYCNEETFPLPGTRIGRPKESSPKCQLSAPKIDPTGEPQFCEFTVLV